MNRRRRILFAALVAAVLGALAWVIFRAPVEPSYQGKSLSQWLEVYQPSAPPSGAMPMNIKEREEAEVAIRHMDTNAVPSLMRMLRSHDSPFKLWLIRLAQKQHVIKITHIPDYMRHAHAHIGFSILGPRAECAVPELIRMHDNEKNSTSRGYIASVLSSIGPPAKAAIPTLLRGTTNTIEWIRLRSVMALGGIHSEPEIVVPALAKSLRDPSAIIRLNAARSLGAFGSDAKSAVPVLFELLKSPNTNGVNSFAKDALQKIDPAALIIVTNVSASPIKQ